MKGLTDGPARGGGAQKPELSRVSGDLMHDGGLMQAARRCATSTGVPCRVDGSKLPGALEGRDRTAWMELWGWSRGILRREVWAKWTADSVPYAAGLGIGDYAVQESMYYVDYLT